MDIETLSIPLSRGKCALITREQWPLIAPYRWYAHKNKRDRSWYALTRVRRPDGRWGTLRMHRLLGDSMGYPRTAEIDHVNRDGLDNRPTNLRAASLSENHQNQGLRRDNASGFKGVWFDRRQCRWEAAIQFAGIRKHLGRFPTAESAARVYDAWAIEAHGAFARLNFPTQ